MAHSPNPSSKEPTLNLSASSPSSGAGQQAEANAANKAVTPRLHILPSLSHPIKPVPIDSPFSRQFSQWGKSLYLTLMEGGGYMAIHLILLKAYSPNISVVLSLLCLTLFVGFYHWAGFHRHFKVRYHLGKITLLAAMNLALIFATGLYFGFIPLKSLHLAGVATGISVLYLALIHYAVRDRLPSMDPKFLKHHALNQFFLQVELSLKRLMDIALSGGGLLVLAPLLAGTYLAIRMQDGGPGLFYQKRLGKDQKPFTMVKFRSMRLNADDNKHNLHHQCIGGSPATASEHTCAENLFKVANDPRITPLGFWIRKYSVDELPQLWNVFIGDMSLVGPRPLPMDECDKLEEWHRRRYQMQPGITGLWQVSGRSELSGLHEMAGLDLAYINHWTLGSDLFLLLRTIPTVLKGTGAY